MFGPNICDGLLVSTCEQALNVKNKISTNCTEYNWVAVLGFKYAVSWRALIPPNTDQEFYSSGGSPTPVYKVDVEIQQDNEKSQVETCRIVFHFHAYHCGVCWTWIFRKFFECCRQFKRFKWKSWLITKHFQNRSSWVAVGSCKFCCLIHVSVVWTNNCDFPFDGNVHCYAVWYIGARSVPNRWNEHAQ